MLDFILNRNVVPDWLLRQTIRLLLARRLTLEAHKERVAQDSYKADLVASLRHSPVALSPETANEQHYELPSDFFQLVLGQQLKYSSAYWSAGVTTLDQAEETMLALTCQRAEIQDGDRVLDLGCGWGSLSLYIARRFPQCEVVGVSNSRTQREFIEAQAHQTNLTNLSLITADMNQFDIASRFDRVVSVEMFEHMRNYELLLERIAGWLKPTGRLFVHVFAHRYFAYPFENDNSWLARNFFTGGLMPSDDLLLHFQRDMLIEQHWHLSGLHYHRTCEAWLTNLYRHQSQILHLFAEHYEQPLGRWVAWKIFFMACSELFRFKNGTEWGVSHYLFRKRL